MNVLKATKRNTPLYGVSYVVFVKMMERDESEIQMRR